MRIIFAILKQMRLYLRYNSSQTTPRGSDTAQNMTTLKTIQTESGSVTFKISYSLTDEGVTFPNSADIMKHNKFRVSIQTDFCRRSFSFYGSNQDYTNGIVELDEPNLMQAFECFLLDAQCGQDTFEEFCGNCGYNTDSRSAEKIHRECIKSFKKFNALFPNADLFDMVNALNP